MSRIDGEALKDAIQLWLAQRVAADLTVTSLAPLAGGGNSAEILLLDVRYTQDGAVREEGLVLRREVEYDFFLDSDLRRQWAFMAAMAEHSDVPVPRPIGHEPDRSVIGGAFLVMTRAEGRAAAQQPNYNAEGWVADLPEARRFEAWRNAIEILPEIHRLDWREGFGFLSAPKYGEPGLPQLLGYTRAWRDWTTGARAFPIIDAALDYLEREAPGDARVCVLWGDATPSNVLFGPDLAVNAIIDFEAVRIGPPEFDLAWWLYLNQLLSVGMGHARLPGLPTREETIAIYEAASGRKAERMDYYDVVVCLHMALVMIRSMDRQVELGRLDAVGNAPTNNPVTVDLAARLGLPVPEVGPDFMRYIASM